MLINPGMTCVICNPAASTPATAVALRDGTLVVERNSTQIVDQRP
jgi:hypothetical protein